MIEKSLPYVILDYMSLERILEGSKKSRIKLIAAVLVLLIVVVTFSVIRGRERMRVSRPRAIPYGWSSPSKKAARPTSCSGGSLTT